MKFLIFQSDQPTDYLALEEALLLKVEEDPSVGDILLLWEAKLPFIVLGRSNSAEENAQTLVCEEDSIPILRRISGGGTVFQAPGCLNYSLILRTSTDESLANVTSTNTYVMNRTKEILTPLAPDTISVQGHTDLTLGNVKFSGNAQARKKETVLFHGTVLYDFDIAQLEKYLKLPKDKPDYRGERSHKDFVSNFPASRLKIQNALIQGWGVNDAFEDIPVDLMDELIIDKYSDDGWNFKV